MKTLDEELEDALIHIDTLNEQNEALREASKELITVAENYYGVLDGLSIIVADDKRSPEFIKKRGDIKTIIDRAKKLINSPAESKREEK